MKNMMRSLRATAQIQGLAIAPPVRDGVLPRPAGMHMAN